MRWFCALCFSILLILSLRDGPEFPHGKMIDLSHSFDSATIYWPTEDGFRLEKEHDGMTDKGYYYAANKFCTAEHGGTHIDAPRHFAAGRQTVDEIPLEQLTGAAILVDVTRNCEANPDYQVTTDDLQAWEKKNGPIPRGAIVLLRTGYSRRWPDRQSYLGTAEHGAAAVARLHFPGLHPSAARWLVTTRSIKAVGLDTASIDYGQSTMFESHRILFEKNVPAFENLANLEQLPAKDFLLIALPMKIAGGSGGPLRAIAIMK
ncbi:MAG TPA: cyclase family protein [Pyrinomonadaceae bacterium]|jgi:kynurenine formamidase|nr:cyclase family protein [Pyrinomonadaceae bacterium]